MQPPLFMDPKIAAQPIKHILSGRGMPIVPETTPYLRNPALANFMHHLHMQPPPIAGFSSTSTSPLLSHSNGSASACSSPNHLASHSPPVSNAPSKSSQQQIKHSSAAVPLPPATTSSSSSSNKLLNNSGNSSRASSPAAKLQQKIVSPIPIPTAHITPFMSHS
ncbi:unnamed protein product [Onchocerca flexuosa]|uniref:Transcription factor Sox-6 n=1 Tax=Onchocerca flexuosa TaxID=387005 RepID=A0A183HTG7_9BILA|nr:unnamed protein product [Onchocerca flexuosa]